MESRPDHQEVSSEEFEERLAAELDMSVRELRERTEKSEIGAPWEGDAIRTRE